MKTQDRRCCGDCGGHLGQYERIAPNRVWTPPARFGGNGHGGARASASTRGLAGAGLCLDSRGLPPECSRSLACLIETGFRGFRQASENFFDSWGCGWVASGVENPCPCPLASCQPPVGGHGHPLQEFATSCAGWKPAPRPATPQRRSYRPFPTPPRWPVAGEAGRHGLVAAVDSGRHRDQARPKGASPSRRRSG